MALKFKDIKSLFIVEDEAESESIDAKPEKKKAQEESEGTKSSSKISWSSSSGNKITDNKNTQNAHLSKPGTKEEIEGEFNEQIFESLTKAVANSNLPGEDYLEFVQALKAMKDLPLDENVKIQTVFATLSTKGLSVPKVIESADYYISVLENEKRKFYTALEERGKGSINNKKKEIADLEKKNKELADKIAALTEEINKNQAKSEQLKSEITEAESKLTATERNFLVTYKKVVGQINNNVKKIKSINP